jgi:hypothetical protein
MITLTMGTIIDTFLSSFSLPMLSPSVIEKSLPRISKPQYRIFRLSMSGENGFSCRFTFQSHKYSFGLCSHKACFTVPGYFCFQIQYL